MAVLEIDERRFNALAGYTRHPRFLRNVQEFAWFATDDDRLVGVLTWDRLDYDFAWVALGQDERLRYRAVEIDSCLPSADAARQALTQTMARLQTQPDTEFHQGDVTSAPVDFFTPRVPVERLHRHFRRLVDDPRYSPARGLIAAMMHYHEDADGNFVEQFQTTGFDARLWELYLFAAFTELGFVADPSVKTPDFQLGSLRGALGVEATTANAPAGETPSLPSEREAFVAYLENYIPIKLARALKRKLNKAQPYWATPAMKGVPFVIALQDFHAPGAMMMIAPAAVELAFGVRHHLGADGERVITQIKEHRFRELSEPSGFFRQDRARNVSALIINPQGTLVKFNRIGFLAGFGDRRVRMFRSGHRRNEHNPDSPLPLPFEDEVHAAEYTETWAEGLTVIHNPNAETPLDPALLPGVTHEFLQPDGRIMSQMPDAPVYYSKTRIGLEGHAAGQAEE